ncbi:MAG: DNA internalization-related competence protein ComEC/Rec2 [Acetivibrionales bacterium]|jgi:competence protein ComEC
MNRPLFPFVISLICGIIIARASHSYTLIILIMVFFAFVIRISGSYFRGFLFMLIGISFFFSLGAFLYLYVDDIELERFREYDDKRVVVTGFVCSEPDIREKSVVYTVKTEEIQSIEEKNSKRINGKIVLTILNSKDSIVYKYGKCIKIFGQMSLPDEQRNPGAFNYREYLAQSGVSALILATNDQVYPLENDKGFVLLKLGLDIRNKIIKVIDESLPEQQAGLLAGMLIGYREGLNEEIQGVFSDSGLTHIMAVSGANIAFIIFPMLFVLKKLRINNKLANIIVMATLVLFVFITGFEPSVVRAFIMAETALLGKIINREAEVINSLSLAAIVLLVYNPYNLLNIGFQLSFAATLSLVLFYKTIKNKISLKFLPDAINDTISATLAAQAGVLPITVYYFNKVSIISLISNIVVVPLTGVITVLGCIMALLGQMSLAISRAIGYVNCTILSFVLFIAEFSSHIPFAVIKMATPSIIIIVLYYILTCFFLWYKPSKGLRVKPRYYLLSCLALTLIISVYILIPKNMIVAFLDVGQGDSIFIKTCSGKAVLIDGGIGGTSVEGILLDYGVLSIDAVIATHGHDDHINGLLPVMENFRVKSLLIPCNTQYSEFSELIGIAEKRGIDYHTLAAGDEISLDRNTLIRVLSPGRDMIDTKTSLNNGSLVLKLLYKDVQLLLTGDIEKEAEYFLANNGKNLSADILKIAHHGSEASSTDIFLDRVLPQAAVISVGKNSFGHPSEAVLKKLTDRGIDIFRTDKDGAVVMKSDGSGIRITKQLHQNKDRGVIYHGNFKE